MDKPAEMLDDKRAIRAVSWADGMAHVSVGRDGVTAIVCYGEPGEHCYKPWLAVYRGNAIWQRICADGKEIQYDLGAAHDDR